MKQFKLLVKMVKWLISFCMVR